MAAAEKNGTADERAEVLAILAEQRDTLRLAVDGVTDEEAGRRTTVSELCLGGIVKHLSAVERGWMDTLLGRPRPLPDLSSPEVQAAWRDGFRMLEGETLAGLLEDYAATARATEEIVMGLPDLNGRSRLPEAPWFPPNASWTARRMLLHLIRETAQHAGHADIIREALDGASTTMRMPVAAA
ncbi:DinB family protein [Nocardiopsis sediminis]|uniref:DinB family protein n=1 Tax=Nocardiopsis sediminis TaxID=1778267 RepID=A0ABV8FV35_9ACTN